MFGSERKLNRLFSTQLLLGSVVVVLLLATVAGCVPITDPAWLVGPSPLSQTPVAEAQADTAEATEESAAVETLIEEMTEEATPPSIPHALARREECLDCHAVDSRRDPLPANHSSYSETVCLYCHMPEEGEAAVPPLPEQADKEFCLGCHGPFEELAARTEGAVVVEDVAANPHMFVPHTSTNIFACKNCHGVHPLPVSPTVEIPQADVQYCFLACHHVENFRPCQECHEEDE